MHVANIIFTLIYCRVNVVKAAFAHYFQQIEQMRPSPHLYLKGIRVNIIFATYLLNSKYE